MTSKRTEKIGKVPLPHPSRRPPLPPMHSEIRYGTPPVARFVPAKAVGSFVPTLTRKAFEKFGFSTAALITDWSTVAGAEIAAYTMPERLRWPRGAAGNEDTDGERRGPTLILRVDPARALDVEYRGRQILERINAYFGYRAVESLRIVQAPIETASGGAPGHVSWPSTPASVAAGVVTTDPLTAALARLEQGVHRARTARRT